MDPLPSDVINLLETCGLQNRILGLQKNIPHAFSSGMIVAEIINSQYPKIMEMHNYADTSSTQGKLANWKILNKKLALFRCEMSSEQISKAAGRSLSDAEIVEFLRKLQVRLPSYEPLYLANQMKKASGQRMNSKGKEYKENPHRYPFSSSTKQHLNTSPEKKNKQLVEKKFIVSTHRPLGFAPLDEKKNIGGTSCTAKIIKKLDERKERINKAANMSDADVERIYQEIIHRFREEQAENENKVNALNKRSMELDNHISALREENLRDLKRTERRLSLLQQKPQMRDSIIGVEIEETGADIDLQLGEVDGNSESGKLEEQEVVDDTGATASPSHKGGRVFTSRRASALSDQIMKLMGADTSGTTEIGSVGKPMQESEVTILSDTNAVSDDSDDEIPPPPPPQLEEVMPAACKLEPLEQPASNPNNPEVKNVDYKRVFSVEYGRHYYVNLATDEAQWISPTEGIVECTDESKGGKLFYTDCASGVSHWDLTMF